MGKKIKKVKGDKPNRKAPKKGDAYVISNDVEIVDVDGNGVADLRAVHKVTKNGELFVDSTVVWYGLDDETMSAFVAALEDSGLVDDEVIETTKFNEVAKSWKNLTKFLKKINDLADVKATELDE